MRVFRGFKNYSRVKNPIVTIGTFDGVHIGHQKILNRLNALATEYEGESLLMTFWPHPRLVLEQADNSLRLLNTLDEKIELLEHYGLDNLLVVPFTNEFSRLSAMEFIRDILINTIGTKVLVIGHDHRFGKNREGSFSDLQECAPTFNYELEEIPPQEVNEVPVSSTKIRKALLEGNVEQANAFLGHYYLMKGHVEMGDQLGRTINYPTANIGIEESVKLIPAEGVYLVQVTVDQEQYYGMLNIGNRPTVSSNGEHRIEVNIFDFDKDIYDKPIDVEFMAWLRADDHYPSLEALKEQLNKDKTNALNKIKELDTSS